MHLHLFRTSLLRIHDVVPALLRMESIVFSERQLVK